MESFVLRGEGNLSWVGVAAYNLARRTEQQHTRLLLRKDTQFFKVGIVCVWHQEKSQFYGLSISFVILWICWRGKIPRENKTRKYKLLAKAPNRMWSTHSVWVSRCVMCGEGKKLPNEEWRMILLHQF